MAITTIAQATSGLLPTIYSAKITGGSASNVPQWISNWYESGYPPAATANGTNRSGQILTSSNNALRFLNPTSGNSYLTGFIHNFFNNIADSAQRSILLVDRLWENDSIDATATGAQSVGSPTWPARDINGTTSGVGVYIAVEISTGMGAATPVISITYTNSSGVTGRVGSTTYPTRSSAPRGHWFPISLQAGDVGVQSVENVTLSVSWVTGIMHLVAYRPIAMMGFGGRKGKFIAEDALTLGMPQLWDNSVLQIVGMATGSGSNTGGFYEVRMSQG